MAQAASNNWNPSNIVKSGWLLRQSTFLKRWKPAWFVLHASGRLSYFEAEHSSSAKGHMHIPAERAEILTADQCDITVPEGRSKKLLFCLRTKSKTWHLCAEDDDDLMAWKMSFEGAQSLQPTSYGQHQGWAPGTLPEGMRAVYPEEVKAAMNFGVYDPSQVQVMEGGNGTAIQLPPGSTLYLTQDGPVIIDAQGNRTLIKQDDYDRGGIGPGGAMLAGAAMGSMMFWPWLFWSPCFWW